MEFESIHPQQMHTKTKNPGIAVVLSFFIPGLGQLYNGYIGKKIIVMIFSFIFAVSIFLLIGLSCIQFFGYGIYSMLTPQLTKSIKEQANIHRDTHTKSVAKLNFSSKINDKRLIC